MALTQPLARPRVDLPQLDAFLQCRCLQGAGAAVGLPVAGAQRLVPRGAHLRGPEDDGLAGESPHPAHRVQVVFALFARVCGDTAAFQDIYLSRGGQNPVGFK